MRGAIKKLSIQGFKSIKEVNDLELNDLNIIISANGAGKSNFVQIFRMIMAMTRKNFRNSFWNRAERTTFFLTARKLLGKSILRSSLTH